MLTRNQMKYDVALYLDAAQFVALYSLLQNVRLGNTDVFEEGLTRLLREIDSVDAEERVNYWLASVGLDNMPQVGASFNNEDGLTITVTK